MYYLTGGDQVIHNIKTLVGRPKAGPMSLQTLKRQLNKSLAQFQHQNVLSCGWEPEIVDSPIQEKKLLAHFIEPEVEGDILEPITSKVIELAIQNRNAARIRRDQTKVQKALSQIKYQSSFLHDIINLTVNRIFFADVEDNLGGSTERALGIIWMNLPGNADTQSIEEFLVHECTHQMTFYDHLADPLFPRDIYSRPKAVAISSIRKAKRPLPLVLDSLLVACEILDYRKFNGYTPNASCFHPSNAELVQNASITLNYICKPAFAREFFLSRGRFILNAALLKIRQHYDELPSHQKKKCIALKSRI